MKRLILFVHGLGGSDETWGKFKEFIADDASFEGFDVEFYSYLTKIPRAKNIVALFSKILAVLTPQQRLPKIQDVAELLKTEIEERYASYDEIYLITHSMGGLVARKYLYDMLKTSSDLQVKKLMLYAVPNNGSDWAKFSKIYKHEQIEQLDRDSDFMRHLNQEVDGIKLEKVLDVLYVIGKYDEVVDESSAKGYWGNESIKALPKGHIDIVKPNDNNDLSYVVLKNFLSNNIAKNNPITTSNATTPHEAKKTAFTKEVIEALNAKRLVVCYTQDHNDIAQEQNFLKQNAKQSFNEDFYNIEIPSFPKDEAEYFQGLTTSMGLRCTVKSANEWKQVMKSRLEGNSHRVLFFFTDVVDGSVALNHKMAQIVRNLKNAHANFYAIFIGGKDLASLVYSPDSSLSPLNTAETIFFPIKNVVLSKDKIVQVFENLQEEQETICECLEEGWNENWKTWNHEKSINTLFWKNIFIKDNGKYQWRDEATKALAKEVFGCK